MGAEKIPAVLRYGSLAFKVLKLADGRLAFTHREGSKRVVVKRSSLEDLRAAVEQVGLSIANADGAALEVGPAEARIYVAARDLLQPYGIAIDAAARMFDEAAKLLGGAHRIVEAARWFSTVHSTAHAEAKTPQVIQAFMASRRASDLSAVYLRKLEDDLNRFASAFPLPLAHVRGPELEKWISAHTTPGGIPVGALRRRKLRDNIITLFNWARDTGGYLPNGQKHEAEKVARPRIKRGEVPIYTPAEMRVLLEHATDRELPVLAIAAFAGLRSEEIMRLEWRDVRFDQEMIRIPGSKSKTGEPRPITLRPNLRQWLAPHKDDHGWVVPRVKSRPQNGGAVREVGQRLDNFLRALAKRSGVKPSRNGFRHSFGTYLCAETHNVAAVAYQMGNSPAMVKRHYLEVVSEAESKRWFALVPSDLSNVLPLTFAKSRAE